jgi:putative membrane protein insertion efficiency factor
MSEVLHRESTRQHRPIVRLAHRLYKALLSPLIGNVCRFEPSCSDYALEALERHGLWCGAKLAIARVLRCHPWNPGGPDPVP